MIHWIGIKKMLITISFKKCEILMLLLHFSHFRIKLVVSCSILHPRVIMVNVSWYQIHPTLHNMTLLTRSLSWNRILKFEFTLSNEHSVGRLASGSLYYILGEYSVSAKFFARITYNSQNLQWFRQYSVISQENITVWIR